MEKPDEKPEEYDSLSQNHITTLIVLHNWKLGRFAPNFIEENITQEMFPFLMEDDLKMLIPEMRERAIFRKRVQEAATANEASARSSYSISVTRAAVYLAVRTNCPQTNQLPLSITITNMNKF